MANYNVDIEVGLKGLNRLQQFKRELEGVDTAYLNIISLTKRLEKQGGLKKFYEGGREQLLKLAGDQMKLDSMLKQGAEIRASYAKDRRVEQQKQAEAEQKAVAQQIADEKQAAIAAKASNVQRLNDQTKIIRLFKQAEDIRQGFADARAADVKLEIDLQERLNKAKRDGVAADQRSNKARQRAVDQAERELAARNRNRARESKLGQKRLSAAVTGGAFPLLFGGGAGQALGGLIGGGLSGEMFSGLTVGLQVLGSAIDQMIISSADLGKALDPISGDFEAVAEAAGLANTATLEHIQTIEELGEKNRALEVATAELTRVVGADGVAALNRFGAASKDLGNATAEVASQAFASIAAALEPLTRAAADFLKTTSAVGQAQVSEDPRLKAVRGEITERMRTYDNQFGGMNDLQNRQAIRDLRKQELELVEQIRKEQQAAIIIEAQNLRVRENVKAMNLKTLEQYELEEKIIAAGNDLTNERVQELQKEQIELDFKIEKAAIIKRLNDGEIDARAVVLALKGLENDRTRDLATLQERINKALGRGVKNGQKTAEQKANEFKQAQDLAREFSREVQLRQSSSDVARDLLQIQFEHEDRIRQINELENQSLRTEQLKSAELLNQLQIKERLATFATTRTEGEVARDNLNREIALLRAKLEGKEEEFLLEEELGQLREAMKDIGLEEVEVYEDLLNQLKDREKQEDALNERLRIQKEKTAELQSVYKQIGQTIETSVVEAISAAVDKTKTLGEVASNVLRQIGNQLLRMGVNQLMGAIFNPFQSLMAPGGPYEGQSGPLPAVPPPLPPVPGKARGGAVGAGQPYLVGERGPELFVPGAQGNIVPNNAMGSTSVVVNVDASGTEVQGSQNGADQLGRLIGAAVQAELIRQKRPGGLLTR